MNKVPKRMTSQAKSQPTRNYRQYEQETAKTIESRLRTAKTSYTEIINREYKTTAFYI